MNIPDLVNRTMTVCLETQQLGADSYVFKGSFKETLGVLNIEDLIDAMKPVEVSQKLFGSNHALPYGVRYFDKTPNKTVVRKIKPEEVGVLGDHPKDGQIVMAGWHFLGFFHSDSGAFLGEAVSTLVNMSFYKPSDDRNLNMNFTGVRHPNGCKYIHFVGIYMIKVFGGVGGAGGVVAYSERGVRGLRRRNQPGNVYPLVNDLKKKQEKQQGKSQPNLRQSRLTETWTESGNVTQSSGSESRMAYRMETRVPPCNRPPQARVQVVVVLRIAM
eukprot:scaffold9142_cov144-Skeletonema_menzelii.AAC.1